ncbi:hypothetical protein [Anaerostipes hadrus]|uniref:hypothetical protein n=1 Tax=Anaerostipes hadrus TaxID=649756 RepID=UPI0006DC7308|nr:hypothetical protein [Anaerostipes hadrus]
MSIAIPSLETTCHSSEWLVEPHHVVRQLDYIQNMDFYKNEKNKQTLVQVRYPLRKAIRRKQKYMHRFISNEDIERLRNLIIAEEHKNCKDYINYKKSYEYLFY